MRQISCSILLLLFLFSSPFAYAKHLNERFNLNFGAFFTKRDTTARADSLSSGTGTTLSFQNDLGLDEKVTIGRIDGFYRFGYRHRLLFGHYDLSRSNTRIIDKTIKFGGSTFPSGTLLSTNSDLKMSLLAYNYSAIHTDKTEIGFTFGLHVMDIDLMLRDNNSSLMEREAGTLPLPVYGFRFSHALRSKWLIKGGITLFAIDTDKYDGRLLDQWLALEHNTYKNVGFGIGYNDFNIDLDISDGDLRGRFDLDFRGLQL